jgi:uncharacterized protein (TIGR03083 family)
VSASRVDDAAALAVADVLAVVERLSPEDWSLPSACAGWTVQDVVVHLGAFFEVLADPGFEAPPNPSRSAERFNDLLVDQRRWMRPHDALEYYRTQSTAGLAALERFRAPDAGERWMPMWDLGRYPLHSLPDAVCFDHVCHLYLDVLQPLGPLTRDARTSPDPRSMEAAIDWMITGVAQMSGAALTGALTAPVALVLTGAGGRVVQLLPSEQGEVIDVVTAASERTAAATITSSTSEFLAWATARAPRHGAVSLDGDRDLAERVLSSLRVV